MRLVAINAERGFSSAGDRPQGIGLTDFDATFLGFGFLFASFVSVTRQFEFVGV